MSVSFVNLIGLNIASISAPIAVGLSRNLRRISARSFCNLGPVILDYLAISLYVQRLHKKLFSTFSYQLISYTLHDEAGTTVLDSLILVCL